MSRTVAVMMVRNEQDVIAGTVRHLAGEVDHIIVADNLSTDDTRPILDDLARELPLTVVDDAERGYYQSSKVSRLAELAATEHDATWIVPADADELWHAPDRISTYLAAQPHFVTVVNATLINHFATAVDPAGDDPFVTMRWRHPDPAPLPKVAFRWQPGAIVHQGNHGVTLPAPGRVVNGLTVRHFPYRSADQFARKAIAGAAAYAATDLPESMGAHWRAYGQIHDRFGVAGLHDVYRTHFWYLSPTDSGMLLDPAPYRRWAQ